VFRRLQRTAALAAAATLVAAPFAAARPYAIDDLLSTETLGRSLFSPDGRWLIVERRRPYASAPRFDYNQQTALLLTELLKVDLTADHPTPTALFPQDAGAGVIAGPMSPDGRNLLVYRLRDHSYRLGIATPITGAVRWFALTPELANHGATAVWRTNDEVILIARALDDLPRQFALGWEAQDRQAAQWRTTREGRRASATAIGSGRFLGVRPQEAPARLVRLTVSTGSIEPLAAGAFQDLALSPDGRWAAAIANGEDLQPQMETELYAALPARRRQLWLIDLVSGRSWEPCPNCEVSFGPLRWSAGPSGRSKLVAAAHGPNQDGDSRDLIVIDPLDGAVTRPIPKGLSLDLDFSPNEQARRAQAAWMGEDLIVRARTPEGRMDWWRLSRGRPVALTHSFRNAPATLAGLSPTQVSVVADGQLWRVDLKGRATAIATLGSATLAPTQPAARPGDRIPADRRDHILLQRHSELSWLGPDKPVLPIPGACEVQSSQGAWVTALCRTSGGAHAYRLGSAARGWTTLFTLNASQADVTPARQVAVRPATSAAPSWLYLPNTAPPQAGYPLVVAPYRGRTYRQPDEKFEPGAFVAYLNPQVLAASGYAVLTPSLPYDDARGEPAVGMAEDLRPIVDAALAAAPLDSSRIGLWGHSLGAMNAVAAAAQDRRYRTVIAASGSHDLVSRWGAFPLHRWIVPEDNASFGPPATVEGAQARMSAPPFADPARYLRNSNLFAAGEITVPVLLVHGETDELRPEQSQELFTALYRQGKDAEIVTYWGEGHALASPANIRDYLDRVLAWLGATLPPSE
jgi:dipeptidyl aminopeptidase/acylaminoacyl peptidase